MYSLSLMKLNYTFGSGKLCETFGLMAKILSVINRNSIETINIYTSLFIVLLPNVIIGISLVIIPSRQICVMSYLDSILIGCAKYCYQGVATISGSTYYKYLN